MTSLVPPPSRAGRAASGPGASRGRRRPLALVATIGALGAAATGLGLLVVVSLVGWYLTDGGSHGAPRDALTTGAQAWLLGHGSGITVQGVRITAVPLGITVLCGWLLWRWGLRVGESLADHGPDARALDDGQRDLTVPGAVAVLTAVYVATAVLVGAVAATPSTAPDSARVMVWSLLLALGCGGTAVAVGAGRAAVWAARLPTPVRAAALVTRQVLVLWVLVAAVALLASFVVDFATAANISSQLGADAGAVALIAVATLLLLPNAVAFSGSYLLGPGFTVGTGTLVSPGAVVLGPLPLFPLLAALPDDGPAPGWTGALVALAPLTAVVAAMRCQRRWPTARYDEGAVRGCAGGVVAGLVFGLAAALAGGAVGPGRMADVAPLALESALHAVTAFGLGGLVGGLLVTWWQRRTDAATG